MKNERSIFDFQCELILNRDAEDLEEIEAGAVQRLATVAQERRWEVIFLTKRPETVGVIAQVQSQRWLASRGFTFPSVYASRARAVLTLS